MSNRLRRRAAYCLLHANAVTSMYCVPYDETPPTANNNSIRRSKRKSVDVSKLLAFHVLSAHESPSANVTFHTTTRSRGRWSDPPGLDVKCYQRTETECFLKVVAEFSRTRGFSKRLWRTNLGPSPYTAVARMWCVLRTIRDGLKQFLKK